MIQSKAIKICKAIEVIAPAFGCHVALTGGCLYKDGNRKDLDILFYRIRQVEKIDKQGLFEALQKHIGFSKPTGFGWIHKAMINDSCVDMFFPEEQDGVDYSPKNTGQV